jgi:hypothetical protein
MNPRRRLGDSGGGGGGTGSNLPAAPAATASLVEYTLAVPPLPGVPFWDIAGGDKITAFSLSVSVQELGESLASFTFAASANAVPTSASIAWTGVASGSQAVTPGTSMSGAITGPFASSTNGAQLVVTLTCVFPDGSPTSTKNITWESPIVWAPSSTPTTVSIATLRAANLQLNTSNVGNYAATMNAGEFFTWANPAGFTQPPTVVFGVLPVTPVLVQSSVAYTNPYGVSIPMDVYTFGVAGTGATTYNVTG